MPEGSYVVAATVLANNLGFTRVPVLCAITGGRIDLQCQSNTGPAGATAQADQMQLTASTVTGIVRQ
ncbi:MAG: hypothetical protein E6I54_07205 [Chloroflexi bacterium]|nr:MAG: hypothetical protein E6I54_07205 [Chloroflexota bacterium]